MQLAAERRCSGRPASNVLMWLLLAAGSLNTFSEAPSLEHIHPVGFATGTTNVVRMTGKAEPWPPQIWVQGDGVHVTALTNKNELQFVVDTNACTGVRLFRLFNAEGASGPLPLVVGEPDREVLETEPNDHFQNPQSLEVLPADVTGRLDRNGDVDSFWIRVPAGQRLVASVDSHVLMSKLDAVLRLVDTNGVQLAWNHDFATIDPKLVWRSDRDAAVVLQVFGFPYPATASINLTGGAGAIYRLHVSIEPPGTTWKHADPGDIAANMNAHGDLESGRSAPSSGGAESTTCLAATSEQTVSILTRNSWREPLRAGTSRAPDPGQLSLPGSVDAFIEEPGAARRFRLSLAKDEWISASVAAESLGSPLDAWLAVEDRDGKELSRNDDANGSRDPMLDWKAPEDGEFVIVVGSLTRNAGPDQFFRLRVEPAEPDWQAHLGVDSLSVKPGSTNEIALNFARVRGFTNEVEIVVEHLPEGVACGSVTVPEKGGEVKMSLVVDEDAPEWQGGIQFVAHDQVNDDKKPIPFKLTATSVNNGVPGGYRVLLADELDHLWLTVLKEEVAKEEVTEGGE